MSSNEGKAFELLCSFLLQRLSADEDGKRKLRTRDEAGVLSSLEAFVDANFDLCFNDELLESIAQGEAANKDETLRPVWRLILSAVEKVTLSRRERASSNIQELIAMEMQGVESKKLAMHVTKMFRRGELDTPFMELLHVTLNACDDAGASAGPHAKIANMLRLVLTVNEKNKSVAAELASRGASLPSTEAKNVTDTAKLMSSMPPSTLATATATAAAPTSMPVEALVSKTATVLLPATVTSEKRASVDVLGDGAEADDEEDEDDDDDEDDEEDEDSDDATGEETRANMQMASLEKEEDIQAKLIAAAEYIKTLISSCSGDAKKLQLKASDDLWNGKVSFGIEHFERVIKDNIEACTQAGYMTKVSLFKFMLSMIVEPLKKAKRESTSIEKGGGSGKEEGNGGSEEFSAYHAPKLSSDDLPTDFDLQVISPDVFFEGNQAGTALSKSIGGASSKSAKKNAKKHLSEVAKRLGTHLEEKGWAVCDNFLPLDLVRRIRIEAGLFAEHYEQSEIWVGREASVGTLLSVPSVRGDKVIWMCGGHKAPVEDAGVSRVVGSIGDIEPCKLTAKARAPMRKFNALKELVKSCDRLMDKMKTKIPSLSGIYERSDAMLAQYPGEGSRFARHIDNTTQDGRRVTLLIYLNPGWTREQGGALRLTPPESAEAIDVFPESGRLAMFYSSKMPHEVMPTFGDRHAITLWYYDGQERAEALARSKESGRALEVKNAGEDAQREAKQFIADLMGGDEVSESGGEPSQEELKALENKVKDLSPEAATIVVAITGAPNVESFREGFGLLTPSDLKSMRQLFRKMGLRS